MSAEKRFYDADDIKKGCKNLAKKAKETEINFDYLIGLNRGGLIPLGYLSYFLDNRNTKIIEVETYKDDQSQAVKNDVFKKQVNLVFTQLYSLFKDKIGNFDILIIDDLIDTGLTINIIREAFSRLDEYDTHLKINVKFGAMFENYNYVKKHDDIIDVTEEGTFFNKKENTWLVFPWDEKID